MPKILHEKWFWCVEKKKIREITGYTVENESKNFESWYRCAIAFYDAAIILYRSDAELTRANFAADFNAALSIEIMLKAIIVKQKKKLKMTHKLTELYSYVGIDLTMNQKYLVEYLTEAIIWFKYPVPKREEVWNRFYDEVFEALIIRYRNGNTFSTVANMERWPSLDNYLKLWAILNDKYEEYNTCDT